MYRFGDVLAVWREAIVEGTLPYCFAIESTVTLQTAGVTPSPLWPPEKRPQQISFDSDTTSLKDTEGALLLVTHFL